MTAPRKIKLYEKDSGYESADAVAHAADIEAEVKVANLSDGTSAALAASVRAAITGDELTAWRALNLQYATAAAAAAAVRGAITGDELTAWRALGLDPATDVEWDDLRFPASGINPVGAETAPTRVTSTTGYISSFSFAGNADNLIAGVAQMPHGWVPGSNVLPHIHWCKPVGSSDAVTWQFYYRIIGNPGDAPGAWSSAQVVSSTIGDPSVSDEHLISKFPAIDMTGYIESAIIYWQLQRVGSTDADNGVAILHELDFHYQSNKRGTAAEIPT